MLMYESHDLSPCQLSMPTITMYCRYILVSRSVKKMHRRINKEINLYCCMCSIISVVSITFNSLSVCLSSLCFTAKSLPPSQRFAHRTVSSNSAFRLWPMHLADVCLYRSLIFISSILMLITSTVFQSLTTVATFLTHSTSWFHWLS